MSPKRTLLLPAAGLFLAANAGLFLQTSPLSGTTPGVDKASSVSTPGTATAPAQPVTAKANASAQPYGRFAELHSCELYTGGCTASSEATLEGRYMLRFWKFEGGQSAGTPLTGLTVALLEKGSENLAMPENAAQQAVAYLPQGITPTQRDALIAWLRTQTPVALDAADIREVPLSAYIAEGNAQVSAGKDIAFSSQMPGACGPASCGERLWYEPRNSAGNFMVDQLATARVLEPSLSLSWKDQNRRSVFTGQFGPMEGRLPAFCGKLPGMFSKL